MSVILVAVRLTHLQPLKHPERGMALMDPWPAQMDKGWSWLYDTCATMVFSLIPYICMVYPLPNVVIRLSMEASSDAAHRSTTPGARGDTRSPQEKGLSTDSQRTSPAPWDLHTRHWSRRPIALYLYFASLLLTACIRKLLTIVNAMVKHHKPWHVQEGPSA